MWYKKQDPKILRHVIDDNPMSLLVTVFASYYMQLRLFIFLKCFLFLPDFSLMFLIDMIFIEKTYEHKICSKPVMCRDTFFWEERGAFWPIDQLVVTEVLLQQKSQKLLWPALLLPGAPHAPPLVHPCPDQLYLDFFWIELKPRGMYHVRRPRVRLAHSVWPGVAKYYVNKTCPI